MWVELLGFSDFGVTDSFFDIGGDSLRAIHMMARVERELDYRVPVTVFVQSPTIAGLAQAIARGETDQADAHIVPLRAGGSLPPLVWLPPIGGSPETYMGITRLLPAEQPVYAAYLVRATHAHDFNLSLPQWAKVYVDELHRRFPDGPLRIAGYSSGAGVAYEVARQLEALGHDIDRLIVLDTDVSRHAPVAPAPAPVSAWRANARLVLRAWQLGYGYRFPHALSGLLGLKNRLLGAPAGAAPTGPSVAPREAAPAVQATQGLPVPFEALPPLPMTELLHRLERAQPTLLPGGRRAMRGLLRQLPWLPVDERRAALFAFLDAHTPPSESLAPLGLPEAHRRRVTRSSYVLHEAYHRYRAAGRIDAPVILLKSEESGHGRADDMGWGRVAPRGVTCVDVPGDHRAMMYPPHLEVTATRLWEALCRPGGPSA
jgi:thioesterase domain-containing protein